MLIRDKTALERFFNCSQQHVQPARLWNLPLLLADAGVSQNPFILRVRSCQALGCSTHPIVFFPTLRISRVRLPGGEPIAHVSVHRSNRCRHSWSSSVYARKSHMHWYAWSEKELPMNKNTPFTVYRDDLQIADTHRHTCSYQSGWRFHCAVNIGWEDAVNLLILAAVKTQTFRFYLCNNLLSKEQSGVWGTDAVWDAGFCVH